MVNQKEGNISGSIRKLDYSLCQELSVLTQVNVVIKYIVPLTFVQTPRIETPLFIHRHLIIFQKQSGYLQVRSNMTNFGTFIVPVLVSISVTDTFKKYSENLIFLIYRSINNNCINIDQIECQVAQNLYMSYKAQKLFNLIVSKKHFDSIIGRTAVYMN
ncbi:Hypothetical_protein [Hexamita inflata]|uniref:Hypothetical_protein n=1 Tax=Hexamita inflata TaxID=28002 RepID=A0ABP1GWL3_9EUKA